MVEKGTDFTDFDPFEITKRAEETNGEFVRFEGTVHPAPDRTDGDDVLSHHRYVVDNPDEHIHPHQEEYINVLTGEYGVAFDGSEHRLAAGEERTIPKNTPHRHWNPTDQPVRVLHEHRPARQSEVVFETLYALAQAGNTDEKGMPNPLQFAVINAAYPGHAYTTDLPVGVQKALSTILAPVGRLAGYEATYSRGEFDNRD